MRQSLVLCSLLAACAGSNSSKVASSQTTGGYYAPNAVAAEPSPSYGGGQVAQEAPTQERPGLGTTWGEQVNAPISFAPFQRASSSPWAEIAMHYNDEEGANAHANYLGGGIGPLEMYAPDNALGISLVDDSGRTLPGFQTSGRALVIGADGARYHIVVRNGTSARFEIVASVDGLDVVDGKPADPNRRGYIVDPHDTLVIDGFRTSDESVAAFRFGRVADSYAAQTSGDRNVGVVGFAIFAERGATWTAGELGVRDSANPFPSRGYAMPPH